MHLSRYFLPTLRETPKEAEIVSHRLMLRAGLIRQEAAGIYAWLPLGLRVLEKVNRIIREEQNRSGAIELLMQQPEFAGRIPVFVGDDPADETGFETVNEMGGHSIRVGNLEATAARYRFSNVSTVIAWLRDRNLNR